MAKTLKRFLVEEWVANEGHPYIVLPDKRVTKERDPDSY